jgi:hypothetical protein
MVFEPTFHEFDEKAAELPDVAGASGDPLLDDIDADLEGAADSGADQTDAAESEADAAALAGDVEADDLPPLGED